MRQRVIFTTLCVLTNIITYLVVRSLYGTLSAERCQECMPFPHSLHDIPGGVVNGQHNEIFNNWPKNSSMHKFNDNAAHGLNLPCPCSKDKDLKVENTHNTTTHTSPATTIKPSTKPSTNDSLPTVFVISPTYARLTQKSDLTSVCVTLMNAPKLIWIVIEDSDTKSDLVKNLLQRCKVSSVHLHAVTPEYYKKNKWRPRGVLQRNAGLAWIRDHYTTSNCNGIVYFGDDDNSYDLRLFEVMRKTVKVSVWPVAFAGGLKYEGPECGNGVVTKWHVSWGATRKFPIDMAGFAVQLCLLLEHPDVVVGKDRAGKLSEPGYLETNLLEQIVEKEELECRGPTNEVIVWHVKTEKPEVMREPQNPSNPKIEV